MFATKLISIFALISSVYSAGAAINTPATLVECQPVLLVWSGGVAPYFLSVIPGGNVQSAPLLNFGIQTGTSLTWNTNITSGVSVSLAITDATGVINYSAPVTILPGTSTACVNSGLYAASSSTVPFIAPQTTMPATVSASSASIMATSSAGVASSAAASSAVSSTALGTVAAVATAKPTSGASTLVLPGILSLIAGLALFL